EWISNCTGMYWMFRGHPAPQVNRLYEEQLAEFLPGLDYLRSSFEAQRVVREGLLVELLRIPFRLDESLNFCPRDFKSETGSISSTTDSMDGVFDIEFGGLELKSNRSTSPALSFYLRILIYKITVLWSPKVWIFPSNINCAEYVTEKELRRSS